MSQTQFARKLQRTEKWWKKYTWSDIVKSWLNKFQSSFPISWKLLKVSAFVSLVVARTDYPSSSPRCNKNMNAEVVWSTERVVQIHWFTLVVDNYRPDHLIVNKSNNWVFLQNAAIGDFGFCESIISYRSDSVIHKYTVKRTDETNKRSHISIVRGLQVFIVGQAIFKLDNCRWKSSSHQYKIHQQSSRTSVTIIEGMYIHQLPVSQCS